MFINIVDTTPFVKALTLPVQIIFTDSKSPQLTERLLDTATQQFEGFGPVIVAETEVAIELTPPFVLLHIVAVTVSVSNSSAFLIFKVRPETIEFSGITTVFLLKVLAEVPRPIKSLFLTDRFEPK
jgi:hypothetical protein